MEKVRMIMSKVFRVPLASITEEATMKDILGWDSLSHMDLIISLENEFGIQLSGEEIAEMRSVKAVEDILRKHEVK